MKIGIYGGAFNPVHLGHIRTALCLQEATGAERVLFIPSNLSPHKSSAALAPGEDRLAMLDIALREYPQFSVCDVELRRNEISYTVDTLRVLRAEYPEDEFYLFVGADMFLTFDRWYMADRVMKQVTLCAVPRDGGLLPRLKAKELEYKAQGGRVIVADMPLAPVSSSELRRGAKLEYLDSEVKKYIHEHHLYPHIG